jgi:hypothetical protein
MVDQVSPFVHMTSPPSDREYLPTRRVLTAIDRVGTLCNPTCRLENILITSGNHPATRGNAIKKMQAAE